jgi:hypothetical protein
MALHGHPDPVTWWDEKMHTEAQKAGFVPMGIEWPATRAHTEFKSVLAVHVVDFKWQDQRNSFQRAGVP